jgi:hypothetical protein
MDELVADLAAAAAELTASGRRSASRDVTYGTVD